jgi:hypothetical protein
MAGHKSHVTVVSNEAPYALILPSSLLSVLISHNVIT